MGIYNALDHMSLYVFGAACKGTEMLHNAPEVILTRARFRNSGTCMIGLNGYYSDAPQIALSGAVSLVEAAAYVHFLGLKGLLIPLATNVLGLVAKLRNIKENRRFIRQREQRG